MDATMESACGRLADARDQQRALSSCIGAVSSSSFLDEIGRAVLYAQ